MIFEYDELREYVEEDFEQFYQMGFNEKQIYPAVLDEYRHGISRKSSVSTGTKDLRL